MDKVQKEEALKEIEEVITKEDNVDFIISHIIEFIEKEDCDESFLLKLIELMKAHGVSNDDIINSYESFLKEDDWYDGWCENGLMNVVELIDKERLVELLLKYYVDVWFTDSGIISSLPEDFPDYFEALERIKGKDFVSSCLDQAIAQSGIEKENDEYVFSNIFEALQCNKTACSVVLKYFLKTNIPTYKLVEFLNEECSGIDPSDYPDIFGQAAIDRYNKRHNLSDAYLLFEIALENHSLVGYQGLMAACDYETENHGKNAGKVLDILKKAAKAMPEKASEIADKIISADDSEGTIGNDDLDWYKAAYKMDKSKKEIIRQIIFERAASETEAVRFCKIIFGADYNSSKSQTNNSASSEKTMLGKKPTRKSYKKKQKGLTGIIKSITKPIYKLLK